MREECPDALDGKRIDFGYLLGEEILNEKLNLVGVELYCMVAAAYSRLTNRFDDSSLAIFGKRVENQGGYNDFLILSKDVLEGISLPP